MFLISELNILNCFNSFKKTLHFHMDSVTLCCHSLGSRTLINSWYCILCIKHGKPVSVYIRPRCCWLNMDTPASGRPEPECWRSSPDVVDACQPSPCCPTTLTAERQERSCYRDWGFCDFSELYSSLRAAEQQMLHHFTLVGRYAPAISAAWLHVSSHRTFQCF